MPLYVTSRDYDFRWLQAVSFIDASCFVRRCISFLMSASCSVTALGASVTLSSAIRAASTASEKVCGFLPITKRDRLGLRPLSMAYSRVLSSASRPILLPRVLRRNCFARTLFFPENLSRTLEAENRRLNEAFSECLF